MSSLSNPLRRLESVSSIISAGSATEDDEAADPIVGDSGDYDESADAATGAVTAAKAMDAQSRSSGLTRRAKGGSEAGGKHSGLRASSSAFHGLSTDTHQAKVAATESKLQKIAVRGVFGMAMIAAFGAIIWAGHLYVCMLVVLLQSLVFKEMVNVRYNIAKEKSVPLFRTLQWSWFAVAVFYTYGDFFHEFVLEHRELLWLAPITKWHAGVSFSMYCCIFVLSVLTLKKGFYRYQVGQLTWTIVTICMIVAQLKFVAHNIFSGLFWFFFPCSLVICNDCFAYFCGMTLGRKIIKAPFLKISPNKTWEGFLGAMVFTVVIAYFAAGFLAQYQWFTCPVERLTLGLASNDGYTQLHCVADPVFQVQEMHIPGPILRFFKNFLLIDLNMMLERVFGTSCLVTKPIQLHAMVMASFTSLIAPFGGFWASAIKRTYGIKDFDSIIPGHGGVTDRMDCQFITALFVSVYFRTFIRPHAVTVGSLLAQASLLPLEQRQELMLELSKLALDES